MNKIPDQQFPQDYNNPPIDKTFVEGSVPQQFMPDIKAGTRIKATQIDNTNPYSKSNTISGLKSPTDILPSGNEPIPLGSGTIVSVIGSGGMAKVYKIWNEKLEVFRAVKILIPGQTELKKRFDTEAKITAKLHHPNIVEIYNVGEWNELPYLEMEFIDGESLESFISKRGKLPDYVCSAIAIQIARALVYAHGQEFLIYGKNYHGVIHRDLKPANIMISTKGEVRLMDFGIARPTEASLHTQEGNIVGTMQYLSPEQLDGIDIDGRTDIYSFGAILYEMLTGTKTFPQDTITNLMKRKVMNDYRKFSEFDFSVSTALAKIAQKCLQLRKEDRYPTADALLLELESYHKANATEPPGKLLKQYLANPDSFVTSSKKFSIKVSPLVLISVAAIAAIGALVSLFILTGPQSIPEVQNTQTLTANHNTPPKSPDTQKANEIEDKPQNKEPKIPDVSSTTLVQQHTHTEKNPSNHSGTNNTSNTSQSGKTDRKPKTDVKTVTTKTIDPKSEDKKQAAVLSDLDRIKQKYSIEDLLFIGKTAVKNHAYNDAIIALENLSESHPEKELKNLLLFEAYLESGRTRDALFIANSNSIVDAQYDYLWGKLNEKLGKTKEALDNYQSALTKPSIARSRNEIRFDALYNTALIWSTLYKANPTQDSRIQMLNAWNIVKRSYANNPDHPRFKKANTELASTN